MFTGHPNPCKLTDSRSAEFWNRTTPDDFDLVVTDQTMPVMTGTELALELVRIRDGILIILTSGYGPTEQDFGAADSIMRSRLKKPFRPSELGLAVRRALDDPKEGRPR